MFGYVKPLVPELKIKEFELYKAFYCGLCKKMGKISGLSKLALNYDIVFLALVRSAVLQTDFKYKPFRCPLKPLKKRMLAVNAGSHFHGEPLEFSSAAAVILTYCKYKDDIGDSKNPLKKTVLSLAAPIFLGMRKRAERIYPEMYAKIDSVLGALREAEQSSDSPPDLPASLFGEIMAYLFGCGAESVGIKESAENFGFHMGRWIYFADALDDFADDLKTGSYNPFIPLYAEKKALAQNAGMVKNIMSCSLEMMYDAFLAFEECEASPVIKNIITLGLCAQQERIFKKISEY